MSTDPIALEIFLHKTVAVTEEMAITLQRTARTTYVKEAGDYGCALAAPDGRFFAYPRVLGVSGFLDSDVGPTLARIDRLDPGDVVITNHAYDSLGLSTHMPDLHLVRPIFAGSRIVAHAWSFIHSADIGGGVPSSISPRFSETFQEGFQIPPMKIVRQGEMNADFLTLYRANCRVPEVNLGDIKAMLAALLVGERRVLALVDAMGADAFVQAQADLAAYAASKARAVQRKIPDGSHSFWDYLDDDFNSPIPIRVRCTLTARDGDVHLDFTGSDPQVPAAYNIPTAGRRHPWLTLKLMHFVYSNDRSVPLNQGMFGHVTVQAPRGTVVNPEPPAAVGIRSATAIRLNEALVGALNMAGPGLMPAPSGGIMIPAVLVEQDHAGNRRVMVLQSLVGGTGARDGADGVDGRDSSLANQRNTPIEKTEEEAAALITEYALRPDSGGAGEYRGGTGVVFSVRIAEAGSAVLGRGMERFVFRPWGMQGGRPGATARVVLNPGTPGERELGKLDMFQPRPGDVVAIMTPGGGGFGDPLRRPPARVAEDVAQGFVSRSAAATEYGVVLDDALAVDQAATEAQRARMAAERGPPKPFDFGPEREAWEEVFDDAAMCRLTAALLRLSPAARIARRQEIFGRVVPDLAQVKTRPLPEVLGDRAAARARLLAELATLEAELAR